MNEMFKQKLTKISRPTYQTSHGYPFPLSDYARASLVGAPNHFKGGVWLDDQQPSADMQALLAPRWSFKATNHTKSNKRVALTVVKQQKLLTLNGQIVYYPQSRVSEQLSSFLNWADTARSTTLKKVGAFYRPSSLKSNHTFALESDDCFNVHGHYYVCRRDQDSMQWFNLEPVQAFHSFNGLVTRQVLQVPPYKKVQPETCISPYQEAASDNLILLTDLLADQHFNNNELLHNLFLGARIGADLAKPKLSHLHASFQGQKQIAKSQNEQLDKQM